MINMPRTAVLKILLLIGLVGHSAAAAERAPASEKKAPPNIVLVISDDHHWRDYSFMGHEHVRTPNLDRLATESLVFMHGYVPSSLCCPSLASIVTGLY